MNCNSVLHQVYGSHLPTLCHSTGGTLPYTGLDLMMFVLGGVVLLTLGYVIRRTAVRPQA